MRETDRMAGGLESPRDALRHVGKEKGRGAPSEGSSRADRGCTRSQRGPTSIGGPSRVRKLRGAPPASRGLACHWRQSLTSGLHSQQALPWAPAHPTPPEHPTWCLPRPAAVSTACSLRPSARSVARPQCPAWGRGNTAPPGWLFHGVCLALPSGPPGLARLPWPLVPVWAAGLGVLSRTCPAAPFSASPGAARTSIPALTALLRAGPFRGSFSPPCRDCPASTPLSSPPHHRLFVLSCAQPDRLGLQDPLQPPLAICPGCRDPSPQSWVAAAAAQRGGVGPLCPRAERCGACVRALGPRPVTAPCRVPGCRVGVAPRGGRQGPAALKLRLFPALVLSPVPSPCFSRSCLSQLLAVFPSSAQKSRCPAAPPQGAGESGISGQRPRTGAESTSPPATAGGTPVSGSHSPPCPPAGTRGGPRA